MSIRLSVLARVRPGYLEQFKVMVKKLTSIVRENEAGRATAYEFFSSDPDERDWIIHECYADADALRAHMINIREDMERIAETLEVEKLMVWGDLTEDLINQFASFGKLAHYGKCLSRL